MFLMILFIWWYFSDKLPSTIANFLSWLISSKSHSSTCMFHQNWEINLSCFCPSASWTHATIVAFVLRCDYIGGEKGLLNLPSFCTVDKQGWYLIYFTFISTSIATSAIYIFLSGNWSQSNFIPKNSCIYQQYVDNQTEDALASFRWEGKKVFQIS